MKKVTYLMSSAVIAAFMLASCSGNKNANNGSDKDSVVTVATADNNAAASTNTGNASTASTADPEETALASANEFFGWIESIDNNNVTIKNAAGETIVVLIPNAGEELIEGSPITVKYVDAEDGSHKAATDNEKSVKLSQNYKKLLGKWGTGKDNSEITFELRKRGKCKNVGKGQNTAFKSWRLKDDNTIEFEVEAQGKTFFMPWTVGSITDDQLVLQTGETSKLEMNRLDSNRE